MHLQTVYVPDDCQWLQCVCAQIPNAFTINKVGMLSWSRRGDRGDKESPRDPHKDFSVSPRLVATLCSFYVHGSREKLANYTVEHAWGQYHPILWEETSMLDQAKNNTRLLIKEASHQFRHGRCHSGTLATGPGPCHDDKLHPRRATFVNGIH